MLSHHASQSKNGSDMNEEFAEALSAAVAATLNDTFGIATRMEVWSLVKGPLALEPFIACTVDMKDVVHNSSGTFIIAFSHETITKVLEIVGSPDSKNPEVVNDAATEIANMVYGMLKTSLNKMGHSFGMAIPAVVENKHALSDRYQNDTKMILSFVAGDHQCKVMIAPLSE